MSSNLKSFNVGYGIVIVKGSDCVELYREYDDGKEEYLSGIDELYMKEDADKEIEELRKKHTWKDCTKEPPGESGVYLVKCVSKADGIAYLVTCCLFEGGEWKSGGIPGENIAFWCEMPEGGMRG
jgi:hypothetical protein